MRKIKHGRLAGGCSDACCLKLEGLSVHIQGEDILEDVSFHLHCGEIAALIGPNGAGKSSLFRSILGQMPYSGTITFSPAGGPAVRLSDGANAPLAARGTRPLIGYVPQSPSFDRGDPVSVLDFFAAAVTRWPVCLPVPRRHRELVARCLARVHGEDLLDEPLSGVDIEGEHQLLEMLDEIRTSYDLSIFLSTHDFATLGQFADKVILLNRRVLKSGPPDEVLSSPEFYETFHLRVGKGGQA